MEMVPIIDIRWHYIILFLVYPFTPQWDKTIQYIEIWGFNFTTSIFILESFNDHVSMWIMGSKMSQVKCPDWLDKHTLILKCFIFVNECHFLLRWILSHKSITIISIDDCFIGIKDTAILINVNIFFTTIKGRY